MVRFLLLNTRGICLLHVVTFVWHDTTTIIVVSFGFFSFTIQTRAFIWNNRRNSTEFPWITIEQQHGKCKPLPLLLRLVIVTACSHGYTAGNTGYLAGAVNASPQCTADVLNCDHQNIQYSILTDILLMWIDMVECFGSTSVSCVDATARRSMGGFCFSRNKVGYLLDLHAA